MALVGIGVTTEIQKTLGSALTITGITKANPGVVTSTAHGLLDGTVVVFTVTAGMVELDGQACRVANKTTDTFELEGIDTTDYSTFSAGTCKEVTVWSTLSNATNVSAPEAEPPDISVTTLIDTQEQIEPGLVGAIKGSIDALFNPGLEAMTLVRGYTRARTAAALRVTWASGEEWITNAKWAAGEGFQASQGQAVTSPFSFTCVKRPIPYGA
jgi:hypothetical protein